MDFLGQYEHQLDAQGRVSLPATFRRGRERGSFVLAHVQPDSLSLFPEKTWDRVRDALRQLARRNLNFRLHVLRVMSDAVRVSPDAQGRILLPQRLRDALGLGRTLLLVGAADHVEIWDPATFRKATSVVDPEFAKQLQALSI